MRQPLPPIPKMFYAFAFLTSSICRKSKPPQSNKQSLVRSANCMTTRRGQYRHNWDNSCSDLALPDSPFLHTRRPVTYTVGVDCTPPCQPGLNFPPHAVRLASP